MNNSGNPYFSICIPNYNYGRYLGETIAGVLAQSFSDFEIVVSDNCSTDNSVEVVNSFDDPRIKLLTNCWNIGFTSNIQRAVGASSGILVLVLSSDDRMRAGALMAYSKLAAALGSDLWTSMFASQSNVIDATGTILRLREADIKLWAQAVMDPVLSDAVGMTVRCIDAKAVLRHSLRLMRTPLPFVSTCFSRELCDSVGGYAGGGLTNPDKWFVYKALSRCEKIYFLDEALFDYRVHADNQRIVENRFGTLKHLSDEYAITLELSDAVLTTADLSRSDVARAFIEHDVVLRALKALSEGDVTFARRALRLGQAVYPVHLNRNWKGWVLRAILPCGPIAVGISGVARGLYWPRWMQQVSSAR